MRRIKNIILIVVTLLYAVEHHAQTNVRQGNNKYSTPIYNWDGTYLRKGSNKYSEPICNWDGVYIRQGANHYSTPLYNWDGT
jgi:hypothetical protein